MSPDPFLDRIAAWARKQEGVRGALLIGSRARSDRPADQWSDYDLVLIIRNGENVVSREAISQFGVPRLTVTEKSAVGDFTEHRVLFDDGQDVDLVCISTEEFYSGLIEGSDPEIRDVLMRGLRWIVDKDRLANQTEGLSRAAAKDMTKQDLETVVQDFWYHAVWAAKKLRRGELWVAKACSDVYLKKRLLRLFEWHAKLKYGPDHDTWFRGRFIEYWLEPEFAERLRRTFACYESSSIRDALAHTMDLFEFLTDDVARLHGFDRSSASDRWARELIEKILSEEQPV